MIQSFSWWFELMKPLDFIIINENLFLRRSFYLISNIWFCVGLVVATKGINKLRLITPSTGEFLNPNYVVLNF